MALKEGTFAAACYDQNTLEELREAVRRGPDEADMKAWGLDADGWYSNIFDAIEALEDDGE